MVTERPCIRCHHTVVLENGHLTYCSACGAPQIFLSEELQAELAEGARAYNERDTAPAESDAPTPPPLSSRSRWNPLSRLQAQELPNAQPWPLGVRSALLSAAVALGLGLLSLVLPPVSLLLVLWVVTAPILTIAFFYTRFRTQPAPGADFAARLGLLTALLVVCCCAVIFTLSLVLTRFAFHDAATLDAQLAASFQQQRSVVLARLGSDVQPTLELFAVPEYRVGLLLSVLATSGAIYLLLSTLAAAVASLLLRRRQNLPG